MGKSGQWYIARQYGADHTLYAACEALGLPLTPDQEAFQRHLEKMFPKKEVMPDEKFSLPKDNQSNIIMKGGYQ